MVHSFAIGLEAVGLEAVQPRESAQRTQLVWWCIVLVEPGILWSWMFVRRERRAPNTTVTEWSSGRAVSRQDFTTKNYSADAASQLNDFIQQVGWRNQLMVSRFANLSQEIKMSQISPHLPRMPDRKTKKRTPHLTILPMYEYGDPTNQIVGTSGKRLTVSPTNNQSVT